MLVVEAGPVVSEPPGMNLRNIADPAQQEKARLLAQGQALPGTDAMPLDIPGTVTARQGTYLVAPGNEQMPAAALASCVGGQGALWTCAVPEPRDTERISFIPEDEWDEAISVAARLLCRTTEAFSGSAVERGRAPDAGRRCSTPCCPTAARSGCCPSPGRCRPTARCAGPAPTWSSGTPGTGCAPAPCAAG